MSFVEKTFTNQNAQPSRSDVAQQMADQMKQQAGQILTGIVQALNNATQITFSSGQLTPQEILAALGDEGEELLTIHGELKAYMVGKHPALAEQLLSTPDEWEFVIPGGGTITAQLKAEE